MNFKILLSRVKILSFLNIIKKKATKYKSVLDIILKYFQTKIKAILITIAKNLKY